jgi:hypothetical protein
MKERSRMRTKTIFDRDPRAAASPARPGLARLLGGALLGASSMAGCASAPSASSGGSIGSIACGGEARQQIDCSTEVAYQGVTASGSLNVSSLASSGAIYQQTALRRVDEETERYLALQSRMCRDYNACVLDKDTYQKESRDGRNRLNQIPALRDAFTKASTDEDRSRAVDALYQTLVPADKRVEEVTLRLDVEADLPDGRHVGVRSGAPLPTDSRLAFSVRVSADAYVYVFQASPDGSLAVLFPNDKIGTKNPLAGGTTSRIPPGHGSFHLNDKDLGIENVYVAASRKEIGRLGDALARVNSGQVTSLAGDEALRTMGNVGAALRSNKPCPAAPAAAPVAALTTTRAIGGQARPSDTLARARSLDPYQFDDMGATGCARSRGLEILDDGNGGASPVPRTAFVARTEPGDGLIVKVFTFEHLTPEAFAARTGAK